MKITVVNSPHVSTDQVRKVILEWGGSVTFPLLKCMDDDGVFEGKTADSFALGASVAQFSQGLKENHDKASLLRLLERLTDVDLIPFVEKGNPDKLVPPIIQDSSILDSGAIETSRPD